jgi:hypothetical protein
MAAVPTSYLYGDSTPSPLKTDFIAFLRDAFDFTVQVLLCDARLTEATQRVTQLSQATERDVQNVEAFAVEVSGALDRISIGPAESLASRCAARVRQTVADVVRSEIDSARAAVQASTGRANQAASTERETCARVFEALVLRHTLPEATGSMRLVLEGAGYSAQSTASTPYGLKWALALEIPQSHPLAHVLRLDRLVERLEVGAPEEAGWLHKEIKIRPQRFDRLHLTELSVDPAETRIKLRAAPDGNGPGFDLAFQHKTGAVQLRRVQDAGTVPDAPYDVTGEDVARLQSLRESLRGMLAELAEHKKSLLQASIDDTPLKELESPRLLADRLIGNIAPTVQQIARRTLSPGELVLKRLVRDNQREEVFLSKSELEKKMEPLPPSLRHAFDPLELWGEAAAQKVVPAARARMETPSSMSPRAPVARHTPLPRPAAAPREERPAVAREGSSVAPVIAPAPVPHVAPAELPAEDAWGAPKDDRAPAPTEAKPPATRDDGTIDLTTDPASEPEVSRRAHEASRTSGPVNATAPSTVPSMRSSRPPRP